MTFAETRPILDQLGYTVRYVQLPGETLHEPPVEGALRIAQVGPAEYALEVVDYGTARRLATANGEDDAVEIAAAQPVSLPAADPTPNEPGSSDPDVTPAPEPVTKEKT